MNISPDFPVRENALSGKTILVTGANRGFGKAIAFDLAKSGATVVMLGRNRAGLEDAYDEIIARGFQKPVLHPLDLAGANPDDYAELAKNIDEQFGALDGIVHNAAILGALTPLVQYDIRQWYQVWQVNFHAPFMMTKFLLPTLGKSKAARVIFVSSGVGRFVRAYWGAYGLSKHAVEILCKTFAEETTEKNMTFNTLDPGRIRTKMRQQAFPAENPNANPAPEDLSPAIVYLFCDETKINSGEPLTLEF